jgi:uncharacterized integral membrane protein
MAESNGQKRGWIKLILIGAVAVYAVLFIAFNTDRARIDFIFASTRISLIFLVLLALVVGFALGYFTSKLRRHR